jgi:hypothetical protein
LAPLGALAAGFAGELIGLRPTILIAAIGLLVPIVVLFLSPLPRLRGVPAVAPADEPARVDTVPPPSPDWRGHRRG